MKRPRLTTQRVDRLLTEMSPEDRHAALRALSHTQDYTQEALSMLRLQPYQVEIVLSEATRDIVRGGTRSGKSLLGFAIDASTFTGLPLLDHLGRPLPRYIDHDGPHTIWTIGLGQDHISQTIHRYLFKPGAFKVIRDLETGELRSYRPWCEEDRKRWRETMPAPPLISERFLVGGRPRYDNAGQEVFSFAEGKDGTRLYAFTSKGDVKMGDPVTLIHVDEDITFNSYVQEWLSRLEDPWSKFLWTAFPWSHASALRLMSRRAEQDAIAKKEGKIERVEVGLFILDTTKNAHIDDVVQKRREADFMAFSPETYAARVRGEFNDHLVEMYPQFSVEAHGTPSIDPRTDDAVDEAVRQCQAAGGIMPSDWSVDVIVDPGHTNPGALVVAMTPPSLGNVGVVVGEFHARNSSAYDMALALLNILKGLGGVVPERTLIDSHAARQSYMGMGGKTVSMHYMEEFMRAGYKARQTGCAFQFASDNLESDLMEVRRWLSPGATGRPKLRFLRRQIVKFPKQMEDYRKHITKDISTDKPARSQEDCLCDDIRYWCASNPKHFKPAITNPHIEARMKLYREDGIVESNDDSWSIRCGAPEMFPA